MVYTKEKILDEINKIPEECEIALRFLKTKLRLFDKKDTIIDKIKRIVEERLNLIPYDLDKKSSKRIYTYPRSCLMKLMRDENSWNKMTYEAIGIEFNKDHATIFVACKRVQQAINEPWTNRDLVKTYEVVKEIYIEQKNIHKNEITQIL